LSEAYEERFRKASPTDVKKFLDEELAPAKKWIADILDGDDDDFPAELRPLLVEALAVEKTAGLGIADRQAAVDGASEGVGLPGRVDGSRGKKVCPVPHDRKTDTFNVVRLAIRVGKGRQFRPLTQFPSDDSRRETFVLKKSDTLIKPTQRHRITRAVEKRVGNCPPAIRDIEE
jgi:hypothetical protein